MSKTVRVVLSFEIDIADEETYALVVDEQAESSDREPAIWDYITAWDQRTEKRENVRYYGCEVYPEEEEDDDE